MPLTEESTTKLNYELQSPGANRILYVGDAFRAGWSLEQVNTLTNIDPWFLIQIQDIIQEEAKIKAGASSAFTADRLRWLKRKGFSDMRLAKLTGVPEKVIRNTRRELGVVPVYKRVDTCAAEFSTSTAYMYSTYEEELSLIHI